jgi:hypothetical protein
MDIRTSEGRGGLKAHYVSGVLTFVNGLTGATVYTVNPSTKAIAFAGAVNVTGVLTAAGGVDFPDSDPGVAGVWWDSAGTLTKSAG